MKALAILNSEKLLQSIMFGGIIAVALCLVVPGIQHWLLTDVSGLPLGNCCPHCNAPLNYLEPDFDNSKSVCPRCYRPVGELRRYHPPHSPITQSQRP